MHRCKVLKGYESKAEWEGMVNTLKRSFEKEIGEIRTNMVTKPIMTEVMKLETGELFKQYDERMSDNFVKLSESVDRRLQRIEEILTGPGTIKHPSSYFRTKPVFSNAFS
jgi:hypothetical protein